MAAVFNKGIKCKGFPYSSIASYCKKKGEALLMHLDVFEKVGIVFSLAWRWKGN